MPLDFDWSYEVLRTKKSFWIKIWFCFSDAEGDDEIEIIGEDNGMVAKGLLPYKPRLSTYPYNSDAKKEGENPGPGGLSAIPGPSSSGEFDLNYA